MKDENSKILQTFKSNLDSVYRLSEFDQIIINVAITGLKKVIDNLKNVRGIDNPHLLPQSTLNTFENIKENNSLRPQYQEMFNQCVVLLVSYFSSSLHKLFVNSLKYFIPSLQNRQILAEEVRVTLKEVQETNFDFSKRIGEWIVRTKDISFQDMQSICRAFENYFEIEIERGKTINNIIIGQACRHIIVHNGIVADDRFINQVSKTLPRDLKQKFKIKEKIKFNTDEIHVIGDSMHEFFSNIVKNINKKLNSKEV